MIGVEFVKDRASKKPDPELRDRVEMASFPAGRDSARLRA